MDSLNLRALGKINLGLDVKAKRPDGYHEVQMVMQTIYLYDKVYIEKLAMPGIHVETNLPFLPKDSNNIAYKAAQLLMDEFHIKRGIHIKLEKRIPVSGGMGGGSTNAAAVLHGMNRLFDLGLSKEALMKYGIRLGADVPYCIMRGTALAEGIGEILSPLPQMPRCTVLIARPQVSVATRRVYDELDRRGHLSHPDIAALLAAIEKGDLREICSHFGNVLEDVTIERFPIIRTIKEMMVKNGALGSMMSGSGPTVFGIYDNREKAKATERFLKEKLRLSHVYVTKIHRLGGEKDA